MPSNSKLNAQSIIIGGGIPNNPSSTNIVSTNVYISSLPVNNKAIVKGATINVSPDNTTSPLTFQATIALADNHGKIYKKTINTTSFTIAGVSDAIFTQINIPFLRKVRLESDKTYYLLLQFSSSSVNTFTFNNTSTTPSLLYPFCSTYTGTLSTLKCISAPKTFTPSTCIVGNLYYYTS